MELPFYCIVYSLILLAVSFAVAAWAIYTDNAALKAEKAKYQRIQGEKKAAIYARMLDGGQS